MTRILIAGAGSLGKRHAESISKTALRERLVVVDPNESSRFECSRTLRLSSPKGSPEIPVFAALPPDLGDFQFAIVSCSSNERIRVTQDLLENGFRGHLILEKLIGPTRQAVDELDSLIRRNPLQSVWVNMPMAFFPQFRSLTDFLRDNRKLDYYQVAGNSYGLVTNAVHYIDHALSLLGREQRHQLHFSPDSSIVEAKRPGYSEVIGSLYGKLGATDFQLVDSPTAGKDGLTITVGASGKRWLFREEEGVGELNGEAFEYEIPLQSESSAAFVNDLLDGKLPKLRSFFDAVTSHRILFQALDDLVTNEPGDQTRVRFT